MEDDTRQRLLDAAEALFAEHGFAETSLRAIIDAGQGQSGDCPLPFWSEGRTLLKDLD